MEETAELELQDFRELLAEQSQEIIEQLAVLSTGELDVEMAIPEGIDELTDIAIGIHFVIEDLQTMFRDQQRLHEELEARFEERTRELQKALADMQAMQRRRVREEWEDYSLALGEALPAAEEELEPWLPTLQASVSSGRATYNGAGKNQLAVPLKIADEMIGVLGFAADEPGLWDEEDVAAVESIVEQVGLALENQRLFEQTQQALAETEALYVGSARVGQADSFEAVLEALVASTALRYLDYAQLIFFATPWEEEPPERMQVAASWARQGAPAFFAPDEQLTAADVPFLPAFRRDGATYLPAVPLDDEALPEVMREALGRPQDVATMAAFPLVAGGRWFGVLLAQAGRRQALADADLRRIATLSDQASNVLETLRLFSESRLRADELSILNQMARALAAELEVEEIIQHVYHFTGRLIDATDLYVALYDEELDEVDIKILGEGEIPIESALKRRGVNGITEYVIRQGRPLLIPENIAAAAEELGFQLFGREAQSWLGAPMLMGQQRLGMIGVQNFHRTHAYNEHDQELLTAVTSQAAISLQNAHLFQQTQEALRQTAEQARSLLILNQMAEALNKEPELEAIYGLAVRHVREALQVDQVSISILDEEANAYQVMSQDRVEGAPELADDHPLLEGAILEAIEKNRIVTHALDEGELPGVCSFAVAPLIVGEHTLGTLNVSAARPEILTQQQEGLLLQFTSILAATIENRHLLHRTQAALSEARTLYDISTRLNSAVTLQETLEAAIAPAIESGATSAVLWTYDYAGQDEPQWQEAVATWDHESEFVELEQKRFRLEEFPLANIWRNTQSELIFLPDKIGEERPAIDKVFQAAVAMPLFTGARQVGLITIRWPKAREFSGAERRIYRSIAAQTAEVVEGRLLLQAAQERTTQLETLTRIEGDLSLAENEADILRAVVANMEEIPAAVLNYIDLDERNRPVLIRPVARWADRAVEALPGRAQPLAEFSLASLWLSQPHDILMINDIHDDARLEPEQIKQLEQDGVGALTIVPFYSAGRWQGNMVLTWPEPVVFSVTHQFIFRRLLEPIAAILISRRAQLAQQAALNETETLYKAIAALNAAQTYEEIVAVVREFTDVGKRADLISYGQFDRPWTDDESPEWAVIKARWSRKPLPEVQERYRVPDFPDGRLLQRSQPIIFEELQGDAGLDSSWQPPTFGPDKMQTAVFVPLVYAGRSIGFISIYFGEQEQFDEDEVRQLAALAGQSAVAVQSIRLLRDAQARVYREQVLRQVTEKVRGSTTIDTIMQTAVRELGQALGRKAFVYLGDEVSAGTASSEN